MASKLVWQRRVFRFLQQSLSSCPYVCSSSIHGPRILSVHMSKNLCLSPHNSHIPALESSRSLCSSSSNLVHESHGPTAIDYRSVLQEGEFHRLADSTIHSLQEKLEDYGDSVEVDGFDIDYGNDVLTVKLGDLGTYVLNKQTPNRQLWLSSPVSGPSRFDWDQDSKAWIYRRNKTNLCKILESELEELCGKPIVFS
ncbi:hypothetical protein TanjilG_20569 [Lupinus angustifolius]|uniref:ferroxidase n=1 Tax=Lupinus angustifolius TaxID=3871 RepID=A0A1J7HLP1_LUPAN|nr:PREDICTED: frataxin, mitochondrial-like [Lupinus angustifolius]OIW03265.1 hypothetical protein TanjilG_20569 [Lupinus angustifolius]